MCLPFSILLVVLLVPSLLMNSQPLIVKPLELVKNDIAVSANGVMLSRVVNHNFNRDMLSSIETQPPATDPHWQLAFQNPKYCKCVSGAQIYASQFERNMFKTVRETLEKYPFLFFGDPVNRYYTVCLSVENKNIIVNIENLKKKKKKNQKKTLSY